MTFPHDDRHRTDRETSGQPAAVSPSIDLSAVLKEIREVNGLSQANLAKRMSHLKQKDPYRKR
jgi:ribosome-binding protein aMBF1 (putative translation factor)